MKRARLGPGAALAAVAVHDLLQHEHTLLRNVPVLGHARYLLETVGPELRQYLVASDDDVEGHQPEWGLPAAADRAEIIRLMTGDEPHGSSAPPSPSAVG